MLTEPSRTHMPASTHDPAVMLTIANAEFERRLRLVGADDWERTTPATIAPVEPAEVWDVRALVNHVIGANRRHTMLLHGASAEATDATRGLDHTGDDAVGSFVATAAELAAALSEEGALTRIVHHPAGNRRGADLVRQKVLDTTIRMWDLAQAIGADTNVDPDVVEFLLAQSFGFEVSGPDFGPVASAQNRLLRRYGRPTPMTEVETFLASMLPRMLETDTALHNGDPRLRTAIWSHNEPLTLLGAAASKTGWNEIDPAFAWIASHFSNCTSADWELLAAEVSGDLAYVSCIEYTTCSINGAEPRPYALRATTILRREDGDWKVVLRHADPYDASTDERAADRRLENLQ